MNQSNHIPVMLKEVIEALDIKTDGFYLDLTLGRGGHSQEILKKLKEEGMLFSFDKDIEAIKESENNLRKINNHFELIHADFRNMKSILEKKGIYKVDGILVDLGVSSPQLDKTYRGFSYSKDARLDMRMDRSQKLDAHFIVNHWTEEELINIFRKYADVSIPKLTAKGIIKNRPINTTLELVDVIRKILPAAIVRKKNPSKSIFQAIRIAVNNELDSLEELLKDAPSFLKKGGNLAIITFHSIEDRIVKKRFGEFIKDTTGKLPIIIEKKWSAKSKKASKLEIEINKRSRSGKLRILKRIKE